jgi:hypothetical protein
MYRVAQIPLVLADDPPEDRLRPEFLSFARTGFRRCDKKCSASIDAYRRGRWPATNSRETHLSEIVRFDPWGSSPSAGEIRSSPRGTQGIKAPALSLCLAGFSVRNLDAAETIMLLASRAACSVRRRQIHSVPNVVSRRTSGGSKSCRRSMSPISPSGRKSMRTGNDACDHGRR